MLGFVLEGKNIDMDGNRTLNLLFPLESSFQHHALEESNWARQEGLDRERRIPPAVITPE